MYAYRARKTGARAVCRLDRVSGRVRRWAAGGRDVERDVGEHVCVWIRLTSPFWGILAYASLRRRTASEAQRTLACVNGSGSHLRFGAKTVGQKVFLSEREVGVSAGWHGTGTWYGDAKGGSGGSAGGSGEVSRRSVEMDPCFRTRLRCESASLSSPDCFSHLGRR